MPAAAMPSLTVTISMENVALAIVARKVRPQTRWAAMGTHITSTARCSTRRAPPSHEHIRHVPSLMTPMQRGDISRVYQTTNLLHGRAEVLKTWRIGIRALMSEPKYIVTAD